MAAEKQSNQSLFESIIEQLRFETANFGAIFIKDASVRIQYAKQVEAMANELRRQAQSGKITWAEAASIAQDTVAGSKVHCVFVFDETILKHLPRQDRRVTSIWDSLIELDVALKNIGGALHVLHGNPSVLIPQLAHQLGVNHVHTNHDDEPQSARKDRGGDENRQ